MNENTQIVEEIITQYGLPSATFKGVLDFK